MPKRFYKIIEVAFLPLVDPGPQDWDTSGDGSGTFSEGVRLSDDGGSSITHRGANTLVKHPDHDSKVIDDDLVINAFTATSAMEVYRVDDHLGNGLVERADVLGADAVEWNEVGTGDLQTLALDDMGLVVYESDSEGGVPEWEPGVDYAVGDQASYDGTVYECIQAHTSLVGWEPPNVPALWEAV